jgi:diphthine-ammonia ligase
MKTVVHWSGGKECCLACQKILSQGHEVRYLVSYIYTKPYIFHSFTLMELQSKTSGIPLKKIKVRKPYEDILTTLDRLKREEEIEGVVIGDIEGAGCAQIHQTYYDTMCEQLGLKLIMPNANPSGETYEILKEELSLGIRPMMNCINLDFIDKEWLGRELDMETVKDLKEIADMKGMDVCSEDGQGYHTMVLDSPLFMERVEVKKYKKKMRKEKAKSWKRNWLYMDIKEAVLKPKA